MSEVYKPNEPYEIYIADGIGMIRYSDNQSITSVAIPSEAEDIPITIIVDGVFAFCQSLESVMLPESITEIQEDAFSLCTSLKSINLPNAITEILPYAFNGCKSLRSIVLLTINKDAFRT